MFFAPESLRVSDRFADPRHRYLPLALSRWPLAKAVVSDHARSPDHPTCPGLPWIFKLPIYQFTQLPNLLGLRANGQVLMALFKYTQLGPVRFPPLPRGLVRYRSR